MVDCMDLSRMSLMMVKVMEGGNKGTRFRGFGGSRADRGSKKRLNISRNRLTLNFPL
jgi:hypothetical protein